MQKDLLPETKQLTVKSHDAQMTDSGSMMCNAKGLGGTGKVVRRWGECSERALDASKASVSDDYIHTYILRLVSWLRAGCPGGLGFQTRTARVP